MGHVVNTVREYRLLQQRLDQTVTGAPDSPVLMRILQLLFTPDDAALARRIPSKPTRVTALAKKLEMPLAELDGRLTDMAARGLVLDFFFKERRYAMLAPIVIGFFEFTFMRTRDELPMAELAKLFEEYMFNDERFAQSVFQGNTQIGRSLVREEALANGNHTEILDWERASHIVQNAKKVGVSLCACRHKAEHLGKACEAPQEVCLTLNDGADGMIRNGLSREISNAEGMCILEKAKEAGLAQTGDNVQHNLTYICNCCGCCCGMMNAIRHFNMNNAIVSSNWVMDVDTDVCKGCGKCAKACPVNAVSIESEVKPDGKKRKWAVRDEELCLGCGVCYSACKLGGVGMTAREKRVMTPESTYDRVVTMAIERGKLADLVFDEPENLGYKAVGRMLSALEKTTPVKAAMAVKPLRSAFLNAVVGQVKK